MINLTSVETEKFWSRIERRGPEECWPWTAGHNGLGYGIFYVGSKDTRRGVLAHRISLTLEKGERPSAFCLHSCDNPGCCNPGHLRWGTQRDNVADAQARKRHRNPPDVRSNPRWNARMVDALPKGEAHPHAKMTNETVAEIYRLRLSGAGSSTIAKSVDLDRSTVLDIIRGRYWAHQLGRDGNPTLAELDAIPTNTKPGAKITATMVAEIKKALAAGETGRSIASRFGIHFASVSDIKRGATWRDV